MRGAPADALVAPILAATWEEEEDGGVVVRNAAVPSSSERKTTNDGFMMKVLSLTADRSKNGPLFCGMFRLSDSKYRIVVQ